MANALERETGRTDLQYIHKIENGTFEVRLYLGGGKVKYIGSYQLLEQAVEARDDAQSGNGIIPSSNPRGRPPSHIRQHKASRV